MVQYLRNNIKRDCLQYERWLLKMKKGSIAFTKKEQLETGNENKDIVVTNCGYFIAENFCNIISKADDAHDYLLIYLHKGTMTLKREPDKIVPQGSVILYEPDEHRAYTFHEETPTEHYYIYFKGKSAQQYLKQFGFTGTKQIYTGVINKLVPIFLDIMDDFKTHSFDEHIFRTYMLLDILNHIYQANMKNAPKDKPCEVQNALNYMENNFQILTIPEYATMCNMSSSTFIRKFKKHTGKTPLTYANDIIINQAIYYLKYSSLSILEISQNLKFKDQFYFSNFFKKHCGMSPQNYRKQT